MLKYMNLIPLLFSFYCNTPRVQQSPETKSVRNRQPPIGYIVNAKGSLASLDPKIYGKASIPVPFRHQIQLLERGAERSLLGFEIGDEYFEGLITNSDFGLAEVRNDANANAQPAYEPYLGSLDTITAACFMDDKTFQTYGGCINGCGIFHLEPEGKFSGLSGCDMLIEGNWQAKTQLIMGKFVGVLACNHYMPPNIMSDELAREKFCLDFEKRKQKTGTFTISPVGNGQYMLKFKNKDLRNLVGFFYVPKIKP